LKDSPFNPLYDDYYVTHDIERKRHITAEDSAAHLREMLGPELGHFIDVGAGNGALLDVLNKAGAATTLSALEISASGIDKIKARPGLTLRDLKSFDGYAMPFANREFETAACLHVIEHVEHERRFLTELGRIARHIYIEIPLEGGLRCRINTKYGHINYYTPRTFLNLCETSGLTITGWKVFTHSRRYEEHVYGKLKGSVRSFLRNGLLRLLGQNRAPELMTYIMGVTVEARAA
jgi:ubiquinone/menaquinone biosynthesis C-methylase UbiE